MVDWGDGSAVVPATGGCGGCGGVGCAASCGEEAGEKGGLGASGCDGDSAAGSPHFFTCVYVEKVGGSFNCLFVCGSSSSSSRTGMLLE